MKILDFLKGKTNTSATEEWQQREKRKRVQFNLDVEPVLKNVISELAKLYFAPHYAVTEHIMQIGISHLVRIAGDEAKVQVLREHLSRDHVLASELEKEDLLLKLGDTEIKTLVLERHHRRLIGAYRMLESAARASRRTRDFEFLEASRKRFVGVAMDMVEYLIGALPTGVAKPDVGNAAGERPKQQPFTRPEPAADGLAAHNGTR
jgi:hypothetical protein